MSIPQTPFEETGDWTTLPGEAAFLASLTGVGGLTVAEAGRSVQDRPIWACTIGTGPSTVLIGSLQHAPEPATRESSLALLRDLAYRTDDWMDDYLASHRVIVVPTINPDGKILGTRNNANGVNLNRDWFRLEQPETRAVQSVIAATDPDIIMDAHETSGQPGADWRPYPAGYPKEWGALRDLATDFVTGAEAHFAAQGWSTLWYPIGLLPFAGLSTVASAAGRVGILSETVSRDISAAQRVEISYQTYRELLQWHQAHRAEIQQARADAAADASTRKGASVIPTREYITATEPGTTTATAYLLQETPPQHLIDGHGITITDGIIQVEQAARRAVVALCDPGSSERVIDALPIRDTSTDSQARYGVVEAGGIRYPIQQVITQQNGIRYPVREIITVQNGIRQTSAR